MGFCGREKVVKEEKLVSTAAPPRMFAAKSGAMRRIPQLRPPARRESFLMGKPPRKQLSPAINP